ncbi:MAG: type II toxin-antitoxin system RelE/ParE family toxin [Fimbriiglobus sp.]
MPRVQRTEDADDDLAEIQLYLSRRSEPTVHDFIDALETTCRILAMSPRLGRDRANLAPGLRSHPTARAYLIFYAITDDGIEVQRILHGSRDITPAMFNL